METKVCPLCDIVLFYYSTTLVTQFECLAVFHPMYYNFCFFVFLGGFGCAVDND